MQAKFTNFAFTCHNKVNLPLLSQMLYLKIKLILDLSAEVWYNNRYRAGGVERGAFRVFGSADPDDFFGQDAQRQIPVCPYAIPCCWPTPWQRTASPMSCTTSPSGGTAWGWLTRCRRYLAGQSGAWIGYGGNKITEK